MTEVQQHIAAIRTTLPPHVTLVCVSKFHPASLIEEAYAVGERDFGESRVQELVDKYNRLPRDIRWHMIGHLQTNKVRQIVPFIHLIHSVDSEHLLATIEREAARIDRQVHVLLEVHVAREESKSGFAPDELQALLREPLHERYPHVVIDGIMSMATLTDDEQEIRRCFTCAHDLLQHLNAAGTPTPQASNGSSATLSIGMSDDYPIAIDCGSTMVRIGSSIFGERIYT